MTENSASELDLVLARLSWQGHLVEVVEVGMAHGPLRRDSLCWIIHLATRSECVNVYVFFVCECQYILVKFEMLFDFNLVSENWKLPASGPTGLVQKAPASSLMPSSS